MQYSRKGNDTIALGVDGMFMKCDVCRTRTSNVVHAPVPKASDTDPSIQHLDEYPGFIWISLKRASGYI